MDKEERFTIRISGDEKERLAREAGRMKMSMSELARLVLSQFLSISEGQREDGQDEQK